MNANFVREDMASPCAISSARAHTKSLLGGTGEDAHTTGIGVGILDTDGKRQPIN
jgi:hypothetical protein